MNPNIFGLFEPQLGQKANKINFGNKNGKNDITHQTISLSLCENAKSLYFKSGLSLCERLSQKLKSANVKVFLRRVCTDTVTFDK